MTLISLNTPHPSQFPPFYSNTDTSAGSEYNVPESHATWFECHSHLASSFSNNGSAFRFTDAAPSSSAHQRHVVYQCSMRTPGTRSRGARHGGTAALPPCMADRQAHISPSQVLGWWKDAALDRKQWILTEWYPTVDGWQDTCTEAPG